MIPLAGMIFASSMNVVSVAAERLHMEIDHGSPPTTARNQAFKAGLIPIFNSLLAVGFGVTTRHDDRSNIIWCLTADRSALSNCRDVHDYRCLGNVCGAVSLFTR